MQKPKTAADIAEEYGNHIKQDLDQYFKAWQGPLPYQQVFPRFGAVAASTGLKIAAIADELVKKGYVDIHVSPRGTKYVFSSACPMPFEERNEVVMMIDKQKFQEVEAKRKETAQRRKRGY